MDIKKFIINRDYGRRMYVPRDKKKRSYGAQMRQITDKQVYNQVKYPHSESKKPYREPDYPTMEYLWEPFGIDWPFFPPGDFPDDTVITDNPIITGTHTPKPDPTAQFLGCDFYVPLTPSLLTPGDTAYAKLMRRDDPIVGWEIHGPAQIIQENAINCHHGYNGGMSSPECTVIIRVNDSVEGYTANPSTGLIDIVLIAKTASGDSCSTFAHLTACEDVTALTWDWTLSDETAGTEDTAVLTVAGGVSPYHWAVVGEDVSLQFSTTQGPGNVLVTGASFCGRADITVTDACGQEATGSVRNPADGYWLQIDVGTPGTCYIPGSPTTYWHINAGYWEADKIQGGYKQLENMSAGSNPYGFASLALCQASESPNCGAGYGTEECITQPDPWINQVANGASCAAGTNDENMVSLGKYKSNCTFAGIQWGFCGTCTQIHSKQYYSWECP